MATSTREHLLCDLQSLLGPRGFSREPNDLEPWLTDWRGRYVGAAAAMLSPASPQEVQAIVSRCAAAGVALVPQGGNTSMVGGATPPASGDALLLSLRRLNRIRAISSADNLLVAEAGATLSAVHAAAAEAGRRFPLSLAAKGTATIGGLVSTNAGGTQVLRFGPMRSLLLGIEAVLPDGSLHEELGGLRKDNRGYSLRELLVGAEGTLGIVTAASLRLVPCPGSRAVAWVGLASPEQALALLRRLEERTGERVESFELVPDNALALVLRHIPGTRAPLETAQPWAVLIESVASPGDVEASETLAEALAEELAEGHVADAAIAGSESQADALWKLRESISEAERLDGPAAKHDISVSVSAMPRFIEEARATVEQRFSGCRVIAFGHLGDGNVHFNVQAPAGADAATWFDENGAAVSRLVYDLVIAAGGSISAEHGIGQMKRDTYLRTAPAARLSVQRAIKAALDPAGIMNPGKLL